MPDSHAEPVVQTLQDRDALDVQALAGLDPIHYREAFAIDVDTDRRPEDWSRLILEGASPGKRAAMLRAWAFLGVKLAPLSSEGQILGWRIQRSGPDAVVLAAESSSGLNARIVVTATPQRVVQAMVIRYDRWFARLLWAFVAAQHQRFVQGLLEDVIAGTDGRFTSARVDGAGAPRVAAKPVRRASRRERPRGAWPVGGGEKPES